MTGPETGAQVPSCTSDADAVRGYIGDLERRLVEAGDRDAPVIIRELRALRRELRDIAEPAKGSTVDALAARRAARQSAASGS